MDDVPQTADTPVEDSRIKSDAALRKIRFGKDPELDLDFFEPPAEIVLGASEHPLGLQKEKSKMFLIRFPIFF